MAEKIALVTGGTRGIGRAIAAELVTDHHVVVGGSNPERIDRTVSELGDASGFLADLTQVDSIAASFAQLQLPRVDVLVHSAGFAWVSPVTQAAPDDWQRMFSLNVFAVAELTRAALPALRESDGQVIAINSGAGFTARAGQGLYSGSKFALRALTDALREEERGRVRVTSIHPGQVDTEMQVALQRSYGNEDYDGSRYVSPQAVAKTVRLAVDNEDASMVESLTIRPVNP
ncbi:SDR family oxidoreductase [Nesterenkonia alba]|uniref:SDR family oxidoreductase n=1 Tax=Nesterenkonia alba TaxID=515814 RepID=UPI0003B49BAB|nr:SDR family oxidoreductase [Nesterenkonia alba]